MKGIYFFFFGFVLSLSSCSDGQKKNDSNQISQVKKQEKVTKTHPGKMIYMQFCIACHMENGQGVPGLYPTLSQTEWVLGDKKRLIQTVLHGMEGPIEVNGEQFNNVMAKLDYLGDKEIADVLTYVRSNFGNNADAVAPQEVNAVRSGGSK
jgi:mono/diheme cytochrome c family protein